MLTSMRANGGGGRTAQKRRKHKHIQEILDQIGGARARIQRGGAPTFRAQIPGTSNYMGSGPTGARGTGTAAEDYLGVVNMLSRVPGFAPYRLFGDNTRADLSPMQSVAPSPFKSGVSANFRRPFPRNLQEELKEPQREEEQKVVESIDPRQRPKNLNRSQEYKYDLSNYHAPGQLDQPQFPLEEAQAKAAIDKRANDLYQQIRNMYGRELAQKVHQSNWVDQVRHTMLDAGDDAVPSLQELVAQRLAFLRAEDEQRTATQNLDIATARNRAIYEARQAARDPDLGQIDRGKGPSSFQGNRSDRPELTLTHEQILAAQDRANNPNNGSGFNYGHGSLGNGSDLGRLQNPRQDNIFEQVDLMSSNPSELPARIEQRLNELQAQQARLEQRGLLNRLDTSQQRLQLAAYQHRIERLDTKLRQANLKHNQFFRSFNQRFPDEVVNALQMLPNIVSGPSMGQMSVWDINEEGKEEGKEEDLRRPVLMRSRFNRNVGSTASQGALGMLANAGLPQQQPAYVPSMATSRWSFATADPRGPGEEGREIL